MRPTEDPRPVYVLDGRLYVNLTSRCPLKCRFCFKFQPREDFFGHRLLMSEESEPALAEVDRAIRRAGPHRELVFCGLGEPLERRAAVERLAMHYKLRGGGPVRVNTSGLYLVRGNELALSRLSAWVDCVAISLNAPDAAAYEALCRPSEAGAFEALLAFARFARTHFHSVLLTAVAYPGVDLERCRELARSLELPFGIRPWAPPAQARPVTPLTAASGRAG